MKTIWKILSMFLISAVFVMNISITTLADSNFTQGSGTLADPFLISTADELVKLSALTNAAATNAAYGSYHYKLTADINMSGKTFNGLNCMDPAFNYKYFTGSFDGDGHIISNLTITTTAARARGFVSMAAGATVKNLGLVNINFKGAPVGGIIGMDNGGSTVTNCFVRGATYAGTNTYASRAGIVGCIGATTAVPTTITDCYAVNITNGLRGGIVGCETTGYKTYANITYCYTTFTDVYGLNLATGCAATNSYFSATTGTVNTGLLGAAFHSDNDNINSGLPVLNWEYAKTHATKTVTVNVGEHGTVSLSNNNIADNSQVTAFEGDTLSFVITPESGYAIDTITYGGYTVTDTDGTISVTVNEDANLVVSLSAASTVLPATVDSQTYVITDSLYNGEYSIILYSKLNNFTPSTGENANYGIKLWMTGSPSNAIVLPAYNSSNEEAIAEPNAVYAVRVFGAAINSTSAYSFTPYVGDETGTTVDIPAE